MKNEKDVEVVNLSTMVSFFYSGNIDRKQALINTFIVEKIGVTQLYNKEKRTSLLSKIIIGKHSFGLGDFAVLSSPI